MLNKGLNYKGAVWESWWTQQIPSMWLERRTKSALCKHQKPPAWERPTVPKFHRKSLEPIELLKWWTALSFKPTHLQQVHLFLFHRKKTNFPSRYCVDCREEVLIPVNQCFHTFPVCFPGQVWRFLKEFIILPFLLLKINEDFTIQWMKH